MDQWIYKDFVSNTIAMLAYSSERKFIQMDCVANGVQFAANLIFKRYDKSSLPATDFIHIVKDYS